ncbi:CaiB/BaiF CoA transferase family protein [Euzebya tangerina]|uniref:CaiB/BaiF CoA transferase family protein n=1 Tax=Euzebya tangerina TaxID=591198 RepID=UPI000E30BF6C|nr:CoA transferase [Euzebya tangerina]
MPDAPLSDIRVIAVEQYGAGPFGSLHLADLGAEVIKIEDARTGGDVGRYVPPFADAEAEDSLFFQTFNRGKRSLSLDLSTAAGQEVLRDLVAGADAVYSNLRGDLPERLGITYDALADVNPMIVCASVSGYGMTGPRAKDPAYDYILQGLTGWMSLTGEPDGPPTKTGLSLVDYLGGVLGAFSLLAGVHQARRDGIGCDCDVSLFDVAVSMLTYPATWWLNESHQATRRADSAHPSLVPFQNFRTADGWMVVGCAKEKFFVRLAEAIGRPELATDPRYVDFTARAEHRESLLDILIQTFQTKPTAEWLAILGDAGVPSGPVNDVATALQDPQIEARGSIVTVDHPRRGELRLPGTAVRVGDQGPGRAAAPERDADAAVLMAELGYDEARVRTLRDAGAFGSVADG